MADEVHVFYGSEVKDLGNGKVGGYLVLFGDPENHDSSHMKDWFAKDTDYDMDEKEKTTIYYAHGLDRTIKNKKLGKGMMEVKDDVGVWVEGQLELRDKYERAIYDMVKKKKLGWSSGVPAHLVRREATGFSNKVTYWPLGKDASLTPTPAEPRTAALALKDIEIKEVEWDKVLEDLNPDDSTETKPYPNEHAARIKEPEQYKELRRKNDDLAPGVDVIYGIKEGKAEVQAIRFDKEKFTPAEAKAWLKEHNFTPIEFEAASTKEVDPDKVQIYATGGIIKNMPAQILYGSYTQINDEEIVIPLKAATTTTGNDNQTFTISVKMQDLDQKALTALLVKEVQNLKNFVTEKLGEQEEQPTPGQTSNDSADKPQTQEQEVQEEDDLLNALYVEPKPEPEKEEDIFSDLVG